MSSAITRALGALGLWTTLAAGCDVGEVGPPGGTTDAPTTTIDAAFQNCEDPVTPIPDSHNQGMACLDSGCHDGTNGEAPTFTAAGTLYNDATGTAPIGGATILLNTGIGQTPSIAVTSANGNFYSSATLPSSYLTKASRCPDETPMLSNATGNCNSAGCHAATGGAGRIHLP